MFLSDEEKLECAAMLDEAFNTFKEQIYIYTAPEQTVVATDSNYIWSFGNDQPQISVTNVTQSGIFWATVEFLNNESLQRLNFPIHNENIASKNGLVRISVSGTQGFEMLKKAEKIVFDDQNFKVFSDIQPRGLFTRSYFDIYLQKID